MLRFLAMIVLFVSTRAAAFCIGPGQECIQCIPEDQLRSSFCAVLQPPCRDVVSGSDAPPLVDPMESWAREHADLALPFLVRTANACGEQGTTGRALQAMGWLGTEQARSELERRLGRARGSFRSDALRAVLQLPGEHDDSRLIKRLAEAQDPSELWLLVDCSLDFGGPALSESLRSRAEDETDPMLKEALREAAEVTLRPAECHLMARFPDLVGSACQYFCRARPSFRSLWRFAPACEARVSPQVFAADGAASPPAWLLKVVEGVPFVGALMGTSLGLVLLLFGGVIAGSRAPLRLRARHPGGFRLLCVGLLLFALGVWLSLAGWGPLMRALVR